MPDLDVLVEVLTPASSFAFITVAELKRVLALGSDTANDAQLQFMIDTNSAVVAALCGNRVFAREKVRESWRGFYSPRLYLTHWPVRKADIESVSANGTVLAATDYQLEESPGKLLLFGSTAEPIVVTYTGGYDLPDEAPMALKHATGLLISISKSEQSRATTAGVRMIAHKESRIMFHPETSSSSSSSSSASPTQIAVARILHPFTRLWI